MKNFKIAIVGMAFSLIAFSCSNDELVPEEQNVVSLETPIINKSLITDENVLFEVLGLNANQGTNNLNHVGNVYTISNGAGGNEVIVFNSFADGSIAESGRYSTGGTGTDTGLGNQGALALSASGRLLFTVNPGSNDFSCFYVQSNGDLVLLDSISSGGETPISVTTSRNLIYVLNAGGDGNISGFGFNLQGQLTAISNSTRPLSTNASGPAQIGFSGFGKALVVTEKATNTISSYNVNPDGSPGSINTFASAGVTPFGFSFGRRDVFYVSEAAGGAANASTVSAYKVDNSGNVSLVSGPFATNGSAACWVVATRNGRDLFATNTGGGDISSIKVDFGDQLSLSNNGIATPTEAGPLDAALDRRSRYLYVLSGGSDGIVSYSIGANGQLTQIDLDLGLPDRASGLVTR
ncbi:lactonase family protein [Ulvibacter antarcticus]|uniref:6-phosphogluconolactonase (Cycloisomerase 2 family) n=1 Tax=Ulvibacter antarcticus TaxID=442714 RepID=A0A3L9YGF9_9FLAO|nr:beta-propeller fold lactonase family protein [Ulvibacter antarcticus]RMA58627.1 6-phosphogluconolactonase (cycloisomerase 2 family) [Ulvibacter antarcticus]